MEDNELIVNGTRFTGWRAVAAAFMIWLFPFLLGVATGFATARAF